MSKYYDEHVSDSENILIQYNFKTEGWHIACLPNIGVFSMLMLAYKGGGYKMGETWLM